jgi:hypothetical protein
MDGRNVQVNPVQNDGNGKISLDVHDLTQALYFLKIATASGIFSEKVCIQR